MDSSTIIHSLNPTQAYHFLKTNLQAFLIDCRSSMEFLFVGHPVGAIHIAWIDEPSWDINPNFATEVYKVIQGRILFDEDILFTPVVLICRCGNRSLEAGKVLLQAGFKKVYNVTEGFEGDLNEFRQRNCLGGWRFHQLPWEQC